MFAARNLHRHSFKSLSSFLHYRPSNVLISIDFSPKIISSNIVQLSRAKENDGWPAMLGPFSTGRRRMSTAPGRGRSMRSKVEKRMQRETGKTMREVRRAKKIQKKLMTENERLVYNLKRAKRKVAVLLQKLKKYELPELPPPRHDPEILTPEQLQAFKKIGFKNKNYATVGVRGVFGGVVQNLHMHWKFHETVQVCCDNFPKEKIKEMATMIARLSGGIVINIHNGKTIIMYRGRNYRQPKNLIPINTLTKRKALFKARFEQALESQKLNIKKIEQQLRRSGINPEDPVATASIQRVASSFFNAIDKKEGTPYVFHEDKLSLMEHDSNFEPLEPTDEKEQAELDKFIADIEDAAEREWAAEEAAEKEDLGRIRYWNREEFRGRFRISEMPRDDRSDYDTRRSKPRAYESDDEENDASDADDEWQSHNAKDDTDIDDDDDVDEKFEVSRRDHRKRETSTRAGYGNEHKINPSTNIGKRSIVEEESEAFRHIDKAMWQSDKEEEGDFSGGKRSTNHNYLSESDEEELDNSGTSTVAKQNRSGTKLGRRGAEEDFDSEDSYSDSQTSRDWGFDYSTSGGEDENYQPRKVSKNGNDKRVTRMARDSDESWDSD